MPNVDEPVSPAAASPAPPRRRRWTWVALAVLLAVAVGLHGWWWYSPRVRPAVPEGDEGIGRLLAGGELPVALWIPYPHQNLGALEEALGEGEDRQRFLAATARLADLPEPELPGFGPFAVPPSHALVALSDEAGERVLVAARVYPVLAAVARLAGLVAGNPWLAGGEVEAFGGTARVAWDGTLWTVGNVPLEEVLPSTPSSTEPSADDGAGPLLAVLRLDGPVSFLPAGRLRLRTVDEGLEVALAPAVPSSADPLEDAGAVVDGLPVGEGLALLAVSGPGGPLERRRAEERPEVDAGSLDAEAGNPIRDAESPEAGSRGVGSRGAGSSDRGALALLPGAGGSLGELLGDLPGAAAWYVPGGERFRLPVERLLGRSRQEAPASDGGPGPAWAVVATSSQSLAAARALTPAVDRLAATTSVALAADPGRALAAVDAVTGVLRVVPIASSEEVERWRDWRTVLAPLAGFDRLTVLARAETPAALRLRLVHADGP